MKLILIFIFTLTLFGEAKTGRFNELIYYSKKVFTFKVEIKNSPKFKDLNTRVYLTTFNKFWFHGEDQKSINWEDGLVIANSTNYTGVIESEQEIFLHPPRHGKYTILEFSPFPIVKFPLEIGKSWSWPLLIGIGWAKMAGIANFNTPYEFTHNYSVTGVSTYKWGTNIISCFTIEGSCKSPFGNSKLIAHFNQKYGFVKMEYSNMDGSLYTFNLENVQELADIQKLRNLIYYDNNSFGGK